MVVVGLVLMWWLLVCWLFGVFVLDCWCVVCLSCELYLYLGVDLCVSLVFWYIVLLLYEYCFVIDVV